MKEFLRLVGLDKGLRNSMKWSSFRKADITLFVTNITGRFLNREISFYIHEISY
jgi:hypothetical protein